MLEQWRAIEGFPNYSVSSLGQIMRTGHTGRYAPATKPLKAPIGPVGYRMVALHADGRQRTVALHTVVCEAFRGPRPSPDHQVAHGDGNKLNNQVSNLRWATRSENMADCVAHGTRYFGDDHHNRRRPERMARGERNGGGGKLTEVDVRKIITDTRRHKDIAAEYEIVKSMVSMIKRREVWKHVSMGDQS